MATLATQNVTRAGGAVTTQAASGGGDRFTPGSQTWIEITNGGSGAITVTVTNYKTPLPNVSEANTVVLCPNGGVTTRIGPFPADHFTAGDGTGLGSIVYSGVTSVTVAVVACSQP